MINVQGRAHNITGSIIGILTTNPIPSYHADRIFLSTSTPLLSKGFLAIIHTDSSKQKKANTPRVTLNNDDFSKLSDGDCVAINPDGSVSVLWDQSSNNNSLLLTEACNCNCLMCPQPPQPHNNSLKARNERIISLIKPTKNQPICITGGEPTLIKEDFFETLSALKKRHNQTPFILLSNGKLFSDFEFTKSFVNQRPSNITTCISLHSDIDDIHDEIAGSPGSFYKTVKGLYNLARFRERVEIRVVINKLNFEHIERFANFIYRNFPFIAHCAFMGQEITGKAILNFDQIWVDPYEYRENLAAAVNTLSRADINTSIYNIPLCLLLKSAWPFAKQSISDWKNIFLPICNECSKKHLCAGSFSTSGVHNSAYINPI